VKTSQLAEAIGKELNQPVLVPTDALVAAFRREPFTGPGFFLVHEYMQGQPPSRQREQVGRFKSPRNVT
jgi:hypothetical protein